MKTSSILYVTAVMLIAMSTRVCAQAQATTKKTTASATATVLKNPKADKGAASLVVHYTGDSPETLFFQETIKLKKAMEGYKKVVLLKHDQIEPWLDLAKKDEKLADIKELPTKSNLMKYLKQLADEGYFIDLWIVGHGANGKLLLSGGSYGSYDALTGDEIEELPAKTGYTKLPIRMIWSTLCYGESLNSAWIAAGAKVVAGSKYINFYPTQFGKFAEAWAGGASYEDAIQKADTALSRTVVQTYLATIHAPSTRSEWGGCPVGVFVLGENDCAKDYFAKQWGLRGSKWQSKLSGKENMNYSSQKIFAGNRKLKKTSSVTWN